MGSYTVSFEEIDRSKIMLVGGKGAHLGELTGMKDLKVPEGFCITTDAFKKIAGNNQDLKFLLDELKRFKAEDREAINEISAKIRSIIEGISIPEDIKKEIANRLSKLGETSAYAVRSSATAEDLPSASFAGLQETYLNIIGHEAILKHISKCWASLFTDRAVTYRLQNHFDHDQVYISVVVQKMVFPQASGILFTADPVTANRKLLTIDAGFGLGEALVAGLVSADNYTVREEKIIDKKLASKKLAIYGRKEGGTSTQQIHPDQQKTQALTDQQIVQLARIGRRIEEHFGSPQDVEWCLADEIFYIVQSRPITTLFPIPAVNDPENHVYVSVGHQQMMTDPIKPLGLSFFLLTTRAPMRAAGGRLFVDITKRLATPAGRKELIEVLGKSDPIIKDALTIIAARENFIKPLPDDPQVPAPGISNKSISSLGFQSPIENDPAIVTGLIQQSQASIETLKQNIKSKSGSGLFEFILEDLQELRKILFDPRSNQVFMTAMNASSWLNDKMNQWLGEKNVADAISQSVPNNITSEMGLALLDVADAIRPHPEIINYLQRVQDDNFLDELVQFEGGREVRDVIYEFLSKYGMRCSGEIDLTKTRWSEKPITLLPMILSNIKNLEPGASHQKFEQGREDASKKERELLSRLKLLPDGEQKAEETKRVISLIRNCIGYREYPKYAMVSRYFIYKLALLKEVERLVTAGLIHEKEDIYYLSFEELHDFVRSHTLDYTIISKRKDEYSVFEKLDPPRVYTSDGEFIRGAYKTEDLPDGALAGLAVSSGVIEGRARVILNMEEANLEAGDILVTAFTDPSWTTLFVSISGLVTEVGGLMTHGAVIAREYGLPAVVGVEHATRLIKDGQRIRVNGTDGYVELL